jgi:hypothetical protein
MVEFKNTEKQQRPTPAKPKPSVPKRVPFKREGGRIPERRAKPVPERPTRPGGK